MNKILNSTTYDIIYNDIVIKRMTMAVECQLYSWIKDHKNITIKVGYNKYGKFLNVNVIDINNKDWLQFTMDNPIQYKVLLCAIVNVGLLDKVEVISNVRKNTRKDVNKTTNKSNVQQQKRSNISKTRKSTR